MYDLLTVAELIVTFCVVVLAYLITLGFFPIVLHIKVRDVVWYLAAGFFVTLIGVMARAVYWSYMPLAYRQEIGKEPVNIIFGAIVLLGLYCFRMMQYMLIPEIERRKYSFWTAHRYPPNREWRLGIVLRLLKDRK